MRDRPAPVGVGHQNRWSLPKDAPVGTSFDGTESRRKQRPVNVLEQVWPEGDEIF